MATFLHWMLWVFPNTVESTSRKMDAADPEVGRAHIRRAHDLKRMLVHLVSGATGDDAVAAIAVARSLLRDLAAEAARAGPAWAWSLFGRSLQRGGA